MIVPSKEGKYKEFHQERHIKTMNFILPHLNRGDKVLDLGPTNTLSDLMKEEGLEVTNTTTEVDLDLDYSIVENPEFEVMTAFEILEHVVSPFPLLRYSKAKKLFISVPLKLWFAEAYWNAKDPYDCHYHEFEPKQIRMLLEKAGWKIVKEEQWVSRVKQVGIRPILRRFTPRHYIAYCERV